MTPRAEAIPHSGIREIFDIAMGMPGVVHLEIGEPDFDTPKSIVHAAHMAACSGRTHYTANAGIEELRTAIAKWLSTSLGQPVSHWNVLVTAGATEASLIAFLTPLSPGDQVLLPSLAWPNYQSQLQLVGAESIPVPLCASDDFALSVTASENVTLTP